MIIRIICIGDELLSGDTINTNLAFIGDTLANHGLAVASEQCVPDDADAIKAALAANDGADAVILVGGLGPTQDDLTRPVTAEYLGRPLAVDCNLRERIQRYLGTRTCVHVPAVLDIQAQVPHGAEILHNNNGTAPGLLIKQNNTLWALLPGPPRELHPMFTEQLLPKLLNAADNRLDSLTVRICGMPESIVETTASQAIQPLENLHFAICIKPDHIMVRLTTPLTETSHQRLQDARKRLQTAFGNKLLPENADSAVQYLGLLLQERNLVMATAESCTGGGIAQAITAIPGSSSWFVGGMVTYANEWKEQCLGVSHETLETVGAVSEETVHQMLDGLKNRWGVPAGVAVSGIAGPGGGTPTKPVGTVVIGAFAPHWKCVKTMHYNGLRDTVRQRSIAGCVNLLIQGLLDTP